MNFDHIKHYASGGEVNFLPTAQIKINVRKKKISKQEMKQLLSNLLV